MSKFTNPISGAVAVGIGSAITTAIGSAIQKHNVHDEAVTALVGGVITGAIAGTFALCLPGIEKDSNNRLKIAVGLMQSCLSLAASLTAPLMGEVALRYGTRWSDIVIDELIGGGVLFAAATGLAVVAALCCCTVRASSNYSFFSSSTSYTGMPAPTYQATATTETSVHCGV